MDSSSVEDRCACSERLSAGAHLYPKARRRGILTGPMRVWIWVAGGVNVDVCNPVAMARRKLRMVVKPRATLRTGYRPPLAHTSAAAS